MILTEKEIEKIEQTHSGDIDYPAPGYWVKTDKGERVVWTSISADDIKETFAALHDRLIPGVKPHVLDIVEWATNLGDVEYKSLEHLLKTVVGAYIRQKERVAALQERAERAEELNRATEKALTELEKRVGENEERLIEENAALAAQLAAVVEKGDAMLRAREKEGGEKK